MYFFGPVSNDQYRDYLSRAKDFTSETPVAFRGTIMKQALVSMSCLNGWLIKSPPSMKGWQRRTHCFVRLEPNIETPTIWTQTRTRRLQKRAGL